MNRLALFSKEVQVVREENIINPDTGAVITTEWIGMKSKKVTFYILGIPIYKAIETFTS